LPRIQSLLLLLDYRGCLLTCRLLLLLLGRQEL
jgi:hypothetical protein